MQVAHEQKRDRKWLAGGGWGRKPMCVSETWTGRPDLRSECSALLAAVPSLHEEASQRRGNASGFESEWAPGSVRPGS